MRWIEGFKSGEVSVQKCHYPFPFIVVTDAIYGLLTAKYNTSD